MNLVDADYKMHYNMYKKMPLVLAITVAVLVFIWSFIDVSSFSRESYNCTYYGIMQIENGLLLVLLIWWIIGGILFFITYFFSALCVSATIVRTDAIIEINKKLGGKETEEKKIETPKNTSSHLKYFMNRAAESVEKNLSLVIKNTQASIINEEQRWVCPECGYSNNPAAKACIQCGKAKQ